jgi:hypothetical protein
MTAMSAHTHAPMMIFTAVYLFGTMLMVLLVLRRIARNIG